MQISRFSASRSFKSGRVFINVFLFLHHVVVSLLMNTVYLLWQACSLFSFAKIYRNWFLFHFTLTLSSFISELAIYFYKNNQKYHIGKIISREAFLMAGFNIFFLISCLECVLLKWLFFLYKVATYYYIVLVLSLKGITILPSWIFFISLLHDCISPWIGR